MLALHLGLSKKRYQTINGIYLCSWPSKGCPWHSTRAENQSIDHHPKHTLQKLEWSVFSPSIPFWTHKTHCLMNQHHLSAFPQASPLPTLHMHMFKKRIMQVKKTVQPHGLYSNTTTMMTVFSRKSNNGSYIVYLPPKSLPDRGWK